MLYIHRCISPPFPIATRLLPFSCANLSATGTNCMRTLADLTSWAPERVEALRRALKANSMASRGSHNPSVAPSSPCCLCSSSSPSASGSCRCSAPSAGPNSSCFSSWRALPPKGPAFRGPLGHPARCGRDLGLSRFDENDLYEALDRLAEKQEHIEEALYCWTTAAGECSHGGLV